MPDLPQGMLESEMKDFIKEHFDKLLLTFLFLVMVMVTLHMAHHMDADAGDVSWGREQANLIAGALLGLITGAVLRNGTKNDNGKDSNDGPIPPTNH
jgi:hypothetical protein